MLIHSVTPRHILTDCSDYPKMTLKTIPGGYIEGYDTQEGFEMKRLFSTDPSAYLKTSLRLNADGRANPGQIK